MKLFIWWKKIQSIFIHLTLEKHYQIILAFSSSARFHTHLHILLWSNLTFKANKLDFWTAPVHSWSCPWPRPRKSKKMHIFSRVWDYMTSLRAPKVLPNNPPQMILIYVVFKYNGWWVYKISRMCATLFKIVKGTTTQWNPDPDARPPSS